MLGWKLGDCIDLVWAALAGEEPVVMTGRPQRLDRRSMIGLGPLRV